MHGLNTYEWIILRLIVALICGSPAHRTRECNRATAWLRQHVGVEPLRNATKQLVVEMRDGSRR